jgi:hypothetical protein
LNCYDCNQKSIWKYVQQFIDLKSINFEYINKVFGDFKATVLKLRKEFEIEKVQIRVQTSEIERNKIEVKLMEQNKCDSHFFDSKKSNHKKARPNQVRNTQTRRTNHEHFDLEIPKV